MFVNYGGCSLQNWRTSFNLSSRDGVSRKDYCKRLLYKLRRKLNLTEIFTEYFLIF